MPPFIALPRSKRCFNLNMRTTASSGWPRLLATLLIMIDREGMNRETRCIGNIEPLKLTYIALYNRSKVDVITSFAVI